MHPQDLLEQAWNILANAGHGDWTNESLEWQEAASIWREEYFNYLSVHPVKDDLNDYPLSEFLG